MFVFKDLCSFFFLLSNYSFLIPHSLPLASYFLVLGSWFFSAHIRPGFTDLSQSAFGGFLVQAGDIFTC